jgi:hypothetical protein
MTGATSFSAMPTRTVQVFRHFAANLRALRLALSCLLLDEQSLSSADKTPDANLSKGMRQLNSVDTQHVNRTHGCIGHLFQGRFQGIRVEKDRSLLALARYDAQESPDWSLS